MMFDGCVGKSSHSSPIKVEQASKTVRLPNQPDFSPRSDLTVHFPTQCHPLACIKSAASHRRLCLDDPPHKRVTHCVTSRNIERRYGRQMRAMPCFDIERAHTRINRGGSVTALGRA